jgi:hypothetical protein
MDTRANRIDISDDLMARNDGEFGIWQFSINDVEIGAAHAACRNSHANFARGGRRRWQLTELQGNAGPVENHGEHSAAPSQLSQRRQ